MRRIYLDNIRWITIVLVIIYHVFYMYNGVAIAGVIGPFSEVQYQDGVQYLLYPWFMVILFIIAGMCSRYYHEKHTIKEFISSRTRKLLVPSTIGLLVIGWIQGYFSMAMSDAFSQMSGVPKVALYFIMVLSGTGVLWFIQLLWLFSMVLALIRRFEKGKLYEFTKKTNVIAAILLVIPVYLSGLVLNMPIVSVYRFGIYGFTFLLGYFVFAHDEVIDRLCGYAVPFIIAAAVLGILYTVLHFGDNYAVMPVVGSIPAVAYLWVACLAWLSAMKRWGDKEFKITAFMSKRSFGLYVFHYLPLSATAYLLDKYTNTPAVLCYILVAAAAFLGSFLLNEAISRIPILRWCVLGIKTPKTQADT